MKKEVQINKLDDHIGMLIKGVKWYIIYDGEGMSAISNDNAVCACIRRPNDFFGSYKDFISTYKAMCDLDYQISTLYLFDTRKELYKWLAED